MLSRRQSPVLSTTENSRWMNVNVFVLNDTSAVAFSIFSYSFVIFCIERAYTDIYWFVKTKVRVLGGMWSYMHILGLQVVHKGQLYWPQSGSNLMDYTQPSFLVKAVASVQKCFLQCVFLSTKFVPTYLLVPTWIWSPVFWGWTYIWSWNEEFSTGALVPVGAQWHNSPRWQQCTNNISKLKLSFCITTVTMWLVKQATPATMTGFYSWVWLLPFFVQCNKVVTPRVMSLSTGTAR